MRVRSLLLSALLALALSQDAATVLAANQVVALFAPEIADGAGAAPGAGGAPDRETLAPRIEQALTEKLQDRFDVRAAGPGGGAAAADLRRHRARALAATYTLTAVVTRIGRTVALDLVLAPVEEPGKGKAVVVTATDAGAAPTRPGELPFVYRRLVIEGAAKLKLAFFGDETVGGGAGRRRIPRLGGSVGRSRSIPGEVISIAMSDTDRDGKDEVVAAYGDSIGIYGVEGDDLFEKARIPCPEGGIVHVDAADLNRDGIAEIVAVRYRSGKAVSDLWEFDGKGYRRAASDLPVFLRAIDLGSEGVVLAGQESDPATVFRGPVFRVTVGGSGTGQGYGRGAALPLPDGTWIYSFTPVRYAGKPRFALLGDDGRLSLLDDTGKRLDESADTVAGTDVVLDAPLAPGRSARRISLPNRLFAVDADGDGNDEIIVLNNLVVPGGFFENIRVYSNCEALCFAQDGERLGLAWRTPQIDGAARDSFIAWRKSRGTLRVGVAIRERGKILGSFGEWRVLWLR